MWAPISVEIFSSVLVLAREHCWLCLVYWSTRTSAVPTGARPHHKPSNSSSRGTDITFVSNSCLQLSLFICIYFIFFFIYCYCWSVWTAPLSSTGPGQSTQPTASTADKTPNLYWKYYGNTGPRWNKSIKEPAVQNSWRCRACFCVPLEGSGLLLRPEAAAVRAAGSGPVYGCRQIHHITGGCDRRSKPVWHGVDLWFWVFHFLIFF